MGKIQKFENFFSSVFGSHLDPEDSEAVEKKEETEKKLQKILHLVNAEDSDAVSANSLDKSELAALIEDIQRGYHSLYGRYSHLTENLKKKIKHKKHSNGRLSLRFKSSESDSSDSESSDSDEEALSNNHEGKTELGSLKEDYRLLQEQLKEVNSENDKLRREVASALQTIGEFETSKGKFEEIQATKDVLENDLHNLGRNLEALQIENEELKQKMESLILEKDEKEKSLEEFKYEIQQLKDLISTLGSEKEDLKQGLEERTQEVATLHEQLHETRQQNEALSSENLSLLSKVQDAEKKMLDYANEAKLELESATDELSSKIKELLAENESLKSNLEDGHKQEQDLTKRLADLEEEIAGHKSELLAYPIKIQMLESSYSDLKNQSDLLTDEKHALLNAIDGLKDQLKEIEDQNEALKNDCAEYSTMTLEEQKKSQILSSEMEEVKNRYEVLKLEYEAKIQEASELKQILVSTEEEKKLVLLENQELLTKVKVVEKELDDLEAQKEQLETAKSELLIKLDTLAMEVETVNFQLVDLKRELGASVELVEKLTLESSSARSELDQAAIKLGEVTRELEQLKEENSILGQTHSTLQAKLDDSSAQREIASTELDDLSTEISVLKEENVAIVMELEHARTNIDAREKELKFLVEQNSVLQQANQEINDKSSNLEKRLEEKIAEVLSLKNSSEEQQKEAAEKIQGLTEQINALQAELALLHNLKRELESQIVIVSAEYQHLMTDFEDNLRSKILKQENSVAILESSFNNLVKHCWQLKHQLQETRRKLDAEEAICREQTSEIKKLMEIRQGLERNLEVFRSEKMDTSKEVANLQNQHQSLEVQLRLALQKLKITESQYKEKEKVFRGEVAKLEGGSRIREERIKTLSGILALTQTELSRILKSVELGISDVGVELEELEAVFAQKHDFIVSQLSVFIMEVSSLKSELHNQLSEKQEMNRALHTLELRLNENEETISALTFASEELKAQLAERDKQIEQMLGTNVKSGKRLKELEKIVLDKEEEILARNEEKREAIRQLCLLCEYYRELNDLLFTRIKFKR